jgi:hypothetical protein
VPGLKPIPVGQPDGTFEITFRIVDVSATDQVGGANFEIPTDVPGYEVIGGSILNPHPGSPDWAAQFNPTAVFRPSENDFFLSFFSCLQLPDESCDFQFLSSNVDIAVVTVRELEAGAAITLKPASAIAAVVDGETTGVQLGGRVIPLESDRDGDLVPDSGDNCPNEPNPGQDSDACLCGDASGDGETNFIDGRLILLGQVPPEGLRRADVNGDGERNFFDGRLILLGQIPPDQCPAAATPPPP